MSNLDYPISVLTEERDNIHGLPKNRAEQLNRAIDILNDERYKLVKQEFKVDTERMTIDEIKKKMKEKEKEIDDDLKNIKL